MQTILLYFKIQIDLKISIIIPELVFINKKRTFQLVDLTVPVNYRVKTKSDHYKKKTPKKKKKPNTGILLEN